MDIGHHGGGYGQVGLGQAMDVGDPDLNFDPLDPTLGIPPQQAQQQQGQPNQGTGAWYDTDL